MTLEFKSRKQALWKFALAMIFVGLAGYGLGSIAAQIANALGS